MAAIYDPKCRVTSVKKISTPAFDKENGGYAEYEIVAEVKFSLYNDAKNINEIVEQLKAEALDKLEHALS